MTRKRFTDRPSVNMYRYTELRILENCNKLEMT